ncbi:MAG TPA: hypothetical protein VEK08_17570 [Planctomycetota bacterium]|nr:hypothetical protein [Planctomycetota bacterium]
MSKLAGYTRAALLGVLFAMVGFSYTLATTNSSSDEVGASSRAVGSLPLRFTNPLIPGTDIYDLGDITAGSTLTRRLTAAGGMPPYTFSGAGVGTALNPVTAGAALGLSNVSLTSFALFGSFTFTVAANVTNNIGVGFQVTDFVGSNDTGVFRLTLVSGTAFRFATSVLPEGFQLRPYFAQFEFINGTPASVTTDAAGAAALRDVGLILNTDGTITGKPTKAGTISLKINAVNTSGAAALGRGSTTPGQTFTLAINSNVVVSSEVATGGITIKQGKAGKDSIAYNATIPTFSFAELNGLQAFLKVTSIANVGIPGSATVASGLFISDAVTLDAKGKGTTADKATKASISTKGQLKFTASKLTLTGFGAGDVSIEFSLVNPTTKAVFFKGTDTVTLNSKLAYKLGQQPTTPTGVFQVTSVAGKDAKTGDGTSFKVGIIALPSGRVTGSLIGGNSASVAIGNGTKAITDTLAGTTKNGFASSKVAKAPDKVLSVKMSAKNGKGSVTTDALSSAKTGIAQAKTGLSSNFLLQLTLFAGQNGTGAVNFAGEGGAKLANKGSKQLTTTK